MNATEINQQIENAIVSRKRQINVEFEGFDPGFKMPQDREIERLSNELTALRHVRIQGVLYSADDIQAKREEMNRFVKSFMSANPGQGVPSAKVNEWQSIVGLNAPQLKSAVAKLGL